jgi:hypothetical protein
VQRKILGAVAAGTLLLGLTACGSDDKNPPQASASPAPATSSASPSPSATPSPTRSPSSSGDLEKIVMKDSDVDRTDLTLDTDGIEPAPKADDLSTPTFDYCGGTFEQEGSRTERYAVVAGFTKPQNGAVFNEVVRYGSADEAENALDEFRTAVRDCDGGSYPSVLNDGEDVTFDPQQGPSSVDELNTNNTVVQSNLTAGGNKIALTQFIAQYDDTLVITYAATQGTTQSAVNRAVGSIGALVGQRL